LYMIYIGICIVVCDLYKHVLGLCMNSIGICMVLYDYIGICMSYMISM